MNDNSYDKAGTANGVLVLTERFAQANLRFALALACCLGFSALVSSAEESGTSNLDCWLLTLSQHAGLSMPNADAAGVHGQIAKVSAADKAIIRGRFDAQDRVLVHVLLNGQTSIDDVAAQMKYLQGQVLDREPNVHHGIFAAYVRTDELKNASTIKEISGVDHGSASDRTT